MIKKNQERACCLPTDQKSGSCRVESVVTVDERGQMVLPKEIRERAKIRAGDKLAIMSWEKEGKVCCICLVKADDLTGMVKDFLGPMMKEMAAK